MEKWFLLSLDISTKTVGVALFDNNGELMELTHISPLVKPKPESKTQELLMKADLFADFIEKYKDLNIKYCAIEEPLLRSNNVYTVGTLLRFNGILSKIVYDKFKVVSDYFSTYEARKNAYPELMGDNGKGKKVLFGGLPKELDKKHYIWKKVCALEPQILWGYDKKGDVKKESYDQADAYTVGRAFLKINKFI